MYNFSNETRQSVYMYELIIAYNSWTRRLTVLDLVLMQLFI